MSGSPIAAVAPAPAGPAPAWAGGPRGAADRAAHLLFVAACAAIALPTAWLSISTGLFVVAVLLSGGYAQRWRRLRDNPLAFRALLLFGAMALSILWSPASWRAAVDAWWHYRALLVLALALAVVVDPRWLRRGFLAFMIAFAFALVVSYLRRFGVLHKYDNGGEYAGFCGRAGFSLMLALVAFMALWLALQPSRARLAWLVLGLASLANLYFVNDGRSGQVTFLLLLPWAAAQRLRLRGLLAGAAVAAVLLAVAYAGSPVFRSRIDAIGHGLASYEQGHAEPTAEGLRLSFWRHSLQLVGAHPLFGDGAGSFIVDYRALADREGLQGEFVTHNPHNDYLMIAVQQGIAGLVLLAWMWVGQWRMAAPEGRSGLYARALMITCGVAALFTAILLDTLESHLYALLSVALSKRWPGD